MRGSRISWKIVLQDDMDYGILICEIELLWAMKVWIRKEWL